MNTPESNVVYMGDGSKTVIEDGVLTAIPAPEVKPEVQESQQKSPRPPSLKQRTGFGAFGWTWALLGYALISWIALAITLMKLSEINPILAGAGGIGVAAISIGLAIFLIRKNYFMYIALALQLMFIPWMLILATIGLIFEVGPAKNASINFEDAFPVAVVFFILGSLGIIWFAIRFWKAQNALTSGFRKSPSQQVSTFTPSDEKDMH